MKVELREGKGGKPHAIYLEHVGKKECIEKKMNAGKVLVYDESTNLLSTK